MTVPLVPAVPSVPLVPRQPLFDLSADAVSQMSHPPLGGGGTLGQSTASPLAFQEEPMPDDATAQIIQALRPDWPRSVATVAQTTGLGQRVVTRTLERLADEGVVARVKRGHYALPRD